MTEPKSTRFLQFGPALCQSRDAFLYQQVCKPLQLLHGALEREPSPRGHGDFIISVLYPFFVNLPFKCPPSLPPKSGTPP